MRSFESHERHDADAVRVCVCVLVVGVVCLFWLFVLFVWLRASLLACFVCVFD